MKKLFFLSLLPLCFPAHAAEFKKLGSASTSWDGQPIEYPQGEEEVSAIKLVMKPGEKLPYHCHPYNTVGYLIAGELTVEKMNGESKTFKKGDTIVEVANTWHRGYNNSKKTAELVGFYIGIKDVANTIPFSEENKDKCK